MSTFPDQLYHMGGVPVGSSSRFAGWWGDSYFVDFDNGSDGNTGKSTTLPFKNLYKAISTAGVGDTIYIRPRTTVGDRGSNNTVITPATAQAANWTIPQTKHHLSIIGTTVNGGLTHGVSLQSYASLTTATVLVLSPFCTIENVGLIGIASQVGTGLVKALAYAPSTSDGFACTVNNCNFQVYKGGTQGACWFDSGRYNQVLNTTFWHCYQGVRLGSTGKTIHGNVIKNCVFQGATTDIDADISIGDADHILIDSNIFDHAQPALATGNKLMYVNVDGASAKGAFSNNYLATTEATIGTACNMSSIVDIGNRCGADAVWMTNA